MAIRVAAVLVALSALVYLASALGRLWGFMGDLIVVLFFAWLVGSFLLSAVRCLTRIPLMPRALAILIVYATVIGALGSLAVFVVPATVTQAIDLADQLPSYVEGWPRVADQLEALIARAGITVDLERLLQIESFDRYVPSITAYLTDHSLRIFRGFVSAIFGASLVVILSFYIVLDGGRRFRSAAQALPPRVRREAEVVVRTIESTFHGYVRGMLTVSAIFGTAVVAVMMGVGLPAALPAALIAGLLLVVPFIGDWLALAVPLLIAALAGTLLDFLIVLGALLFVQQVMLNLLTPRILGSAVRMPAMLVVVSVVVGARIAGVWGALLGVPLGAIVYSLVTVYGTRMAAERREREAAEKAAVPAERARSQN